MTRMCHQSLINALRLSLIERLHEFAVSTKMGTTLLFFFQ